MGKHTRERRRGPQPCLSRASPRRPGPGIPPQGDRHASGCVHESTDLRRVVAAAVIAAISEEAGRAVTPAEVLAVVRALRNEAEGGAPPA